MSFDDNAAAVLLAMLNLLGLAISSWNQWLIRKHNRIHAEDSRRLARGKVNDLKLPQVKHPAPVSAKGGSAAGRESGPVSDAEHQRLAADLERLRQRIEYRRQPKPRTEKP